MRIAYITSFAATEPETEVIVEDTNSTDTTSESATEETHSESTAHTTEETHSEESEGIGALGLDVFAILAQTITFLVLFWIVKKYALDKIVANLDRRHEDIDRGLHLTAELDKQKSELDERVEEVLKAARKDADVIIANANTESRKIVNQAEDTASRKAEEILRAAESKIVQDIADAREGLKSEMAGLVTEATEAILNQKLDSASDKKLVEEYLKGAMK